MNNRNNINYIDKKRSSNSLEFNIKRIKSGLYNNNCNIENDKNKKEENNNMFNDDKMNLKKSSNNLGEKSGSLYNVLNVQKGFNFFRNNYMYKNPKKHKTSKNNLITNNKIINNNSIKVYSSVFKKELFDFQQKEKKQPKYSEEEKISKKLNKKEQKKPFTTDTNIQLISINNNNIIINNINNECFSSNTNSKKNSINANKREIIIKNNHDKKIKIDREQIKSKIIEKENILFPNLKINKVSSDKHISKTNNNSASMNKNSNNNNKIYSQKHEMIMKPKKTRPFSSGQFKANSNRNIESTLNKNLISNEFHLNNDIRKKINSGRPSTGFKPNYNNNVMNININFYNIDMNRRFLAPEINPLYSNDNEPVRENNANENDKKTNVNGSNINLKDYKNTNEFIFQKLIKAIQDINCQKKLTINDLH